MKKIVVSCLAVIAIILLSACAQKIKPIEENPAGAGQDTAGAAGSQTAQDFSQNPATTADLEKEVADIQKDLNEIDQELGQLNFNVSDETVPSLE